MSKKTRKSSQPKVPGVRFKIVEDDGSVKPRVYSNYVQSAVNAIDVSFDFCEIEPARDKPIKIGADGSAEITARSKVRVVMPHSVFINFADMIHKQMKKLQENESEE